jgi:hypothetical protein
MGATEHPVEVVRLDIPADEEGTVHDPHCGTFELQNDFLYKIILIVRGF